MARGGYSKSSYLQSVGRACVSHPKEICRYVVQYRALEVINAREGSERWPSWMEKGSAKPTSASGT